MPQVLDSIDTYLQELNLVTILFRLALAMGLGGILGIERGKKGQPAGFRTYITVCVASSLATLTGQYIYTRFHTGDPARLGAQVISGIGFLGAGSIIVEGKTKVRGLTTAAGLWTAACIGLAIGIGFYVGGVLAAAVVYVVISKFKTISDHFTHNDMILRLYVEFDEMSDLQPLCATMESFGLQVLDTTLNHSKRSGDYNAIMAIKNPEDKTQEEVTGYLKKIQGVRKVKMIY